jgi:hypothetical protein
MLASEQVELLNINHPDKKTRGDKAKYGAMKSVMLKVLPVAQPGMTIEALRDEVLPKLPSAVF